MTPNLLKTMGLQSPFTAYWSAANSALADEGFPPLTLTQADAYHQDGATVEYILKRARDCREEMRAATGLIFGRAVVW